MRIRIDGPCFIESEQPFVITPIYVSEKAQTPTPPPSEVETPSETPVHRRKSPKKVNVTCKSCKRTFRGRSNAMYCSSDCKRDFYREHPSLRHVRGSI